ncbi:MAG: EamA family transporter [Epulopiscium sp.]|jgi:RarD protein|nr:EamA family transporter [Candidatus Epulonipiscium sp.]
MKAKLCFILSMIIFGTIGIFVRQINMASSEIALLRGAIGSMFLLAVVFATKQKISYESIKKNIGVLLLSGLALGANWMFFFQAYKNTTIANATLSYYFAPVFVVILSPFVLKEKISMKKVLCIAISVLGMFLIIQSNQNIGAVYHHLRGIFYGIVAAAFYATLTLANKFIRDMSDLETTILQLLLAAGLLIPYVLATEGLHVPEISGVAVICILLLGVLHTGVGFYLFFLGINGLKGQSIAALSYIDPITSLLVSFFILGEHMTKVQILGAVLLLGSTFVE